MPTLQQLQMYKNLLKKATPPTEQDVAHMIAQRHAALPTAQGGLGLPAANTPMQRAAALGYDLPAYRGTNVDEASLYANTQQIPGKVRSGTGAFMSENPQTASSYAGRPGGNVMPVMVRSQGMPTVNAQGAPWSDIGGRNTNQIAREALAAGQPGVRFQNVADPGAHLRGAGEVPEAANNLTVFNPADVRSRFAAFDPMKRESEDLMHCEGGSIKGYAGGKLVKGALDFILPAAENAARTQIAGTVPTYQKAAAMLQDAPGRMIDFGAGLGKGAEAMSQQLGRKVETYEPFAQNWAPDFVKASSVPSDAYGGLTNLNVLNVVPRETRDEIVKDIGRVIQPGGTGIITTRGKDVMTAQGRPGPEPMSMITSRDTYQKGFTKQELEDYLKYMLGSGFDINKLNLGPAGILLRKK